MSSQVVRTLTHIWTCKMALLSTHVLVPVRRHGDISLMSPLSQHYDALDTHFPD